jgi:hypothetical protein
MDTAFLAHDAEIGKLFEDRNILISDGGTITFTGTQVQFTDNLKLSINQNIAGATPYVINLGSTSQTFTNSGDMLIATINRTAATGTLSIVTSGSALPAVSSANLEVFLIAKRLDATDGTQRLYFRNGAAFNAGQSARLGSAGSGGTGSGIGDDLDSLQFQASFSDLFGESASNANSSVNATSPNTNAAFNAAKAMYAVSYDASKTVTTSGTTATMSAAPAYTVAAGDVLVSGGYARKITAVASQTSYTLESAFPSALTAASCVVSQAVITKDIYNLSVDGVALSTEFGSTTFSEIMVDYKDNATSGSNIFTPNVGPYVSYVASPDGTNFTTVQTRPSSATTTIPSTILPSAGTSLYLRFFANASIGSGTVNLITYKAFLQKSVTAASTNNVIWSAQGMTNIVGTAQNNMTISVVGGKTTITFTNNTYPIGVNSSGTVGSLFVTVNGLVFNRYLAGTTSSSDGYYTEYAANAIQLDQNYSTQALEVMVVYDLQVIDSSTTNTTAISQQQEIISNNFQSAVSQAQLMNATTTVGTPVAGSFYSAITNRAAIVDFTQDLKPRMGIDRIMTQTANLLTTEFGPNGEPVFAVDGDQFGQVRLVGACDSFVDGNGARVRLGIIASSTAYAEIVFYGTGLNALLLADVATRAFAVSVDGGSETAFPLGNSNVISARSYGVNQVVSVASGLTLGVHTVRIRTTSTVDQDLFGFEIVNSSSNVITPPGVGYIGGKKISLTSQSSIAYNANVTGTRGGRILHYLSSSGTIGQAWNAANSTSLFLTSASHTNEEVARVYFPREFGSSRSDDFATGTSNQVRVFTLDDDTTTLTTSSGGFESLISGHEGLETQGTSSYFTQITFVGTGIDLSISCDGNSRPMTAYIDGTSVGTITPTLSAIRTVTVASGLPYGTHTLKLVNTGSIGSFDILNFIVYQPKKPTLPSGAIALADYNVMANFVANTTAGSEYVSTGVLRKSAAREIVYFGTWSVVNQVAAGTAGSTTGLYVNGSSSGNYYTYTFFGTGFDMRMGTPGTTALNATVSIDGSSNLSSYTTSFYGSVTAFTASTGVFTTNTSNSFGSGVVVSGLSLGLHTVKVSYNSGSAMPLECFDIITPIHSYKTNIYSDFQNTFAIGSQGIFDDRNLTILPNQSAAKYRGQAVGVLTSPTTSATSAVPMPDMSLVVKTLGNWFDLRADVQIRTSSGNGVFLVFAVDGIVQNAIVGNSAPPATDDVGYGLSNLVYLSPGYHKIDLYWYAFSGTLTAIGTYRVMTVKEL